MVQRSQDRPDPTYSPSSDGRGRSVPTSTTRLPAADEFGEPREHLATEDPFQILRAFGNNNAIIPLAGDVAMLPLNDTRTLSDLFSNRGRQFHAQNTVPGAGASTRLGSIVDDVYAFGAGPLGGYNDVIAMSK